MAKSLLEDGSLRLRHLNYALKYLDCEAKGLRRVEVGSKQHIVPFAIDGKGTEDESDRWPLAKTQSLMLKVFHSI